MNNAFPATAAVVTDAVDSMDLLLSDEHEHTFCTRKRITVPDGREVAVHVGDAKDVVGIAHLDAV